MGGSQPEVVVSEERIQERVAELADEISRDYSGVDHLLLVGVLRGAFVFLADLCRRLTIPSRVDFIALSTYGGTSTTSTGDVQVVMDLRDRIQGQHVLIVEDIVDTGYTLSYLRQLLSLRRPESLKACALVRKPNRLAVDVPVEYLGFDIPDVWVVGYGLDYTGEGRALPYIGAVETEG